MYSIIENLTSLLIPFIAVFFFLFVERYVFGLSIQNKSRIKSILGIQVINVILNVFLSGLILVPLVYYSSTLQIFSFANMSTPFYITFIVSFLFLDLVAYWHHRIHHQIPILWRLHRLHHTDKEVDALTTFFHHPGAIFSAFIFTIIFSVMFDVPLIAITSYVLIASIHAPFTHLKKLIPPNIDKFLKYIFVTPNYHLLHHSKKSHEGRSNYGLIFVFWDFLFGTYLPKDYVLLTQTQTGLENDSYNDKLSQNNKLSLVNFLLNPFK